MPYFGATLCAVLVSVAYALPSGNLTSGDYTDVDCQCVSEFTWNQGEEDKPATGGPYKSATGHFLRKSAGIVVQDSIVSDLHRHCYSHLHRKN